VGATMEIDRKRVAAVRTLEALGYTYCKGEWLAPPAVAGTPLRMTAEVDATQGKFMQRLDAVAGCTEGSSEEAELRAIVDLIEACECTWGPLGKDPTARRRRYQRDQ